MEQTTISFDTRTELTQSQLLLWIGQEMDTSSPLYNMALTFELKGKIEHRHFNTAFQKLVEKSDALRTVFEFYEGKPTQRVLENIIYNVEKVELDHIEAAQEWIKERTKKSFDLAKCPFESILLEITENHFIWFFNQHHLITDAWSVSVVFKQMAVFYQLSVEEKLENAPNLPAFRDYIDFEKLARTKPENKGSYDYWQEKLEKSPPIPALYHKKGLTPTTKTHRVSMELGVKRSNELRALTKEKGIRSWTEHLSLYNIFTTVLFSFIHRISGQEKLIIGSPAHNRATNDFKETIGVFIEIFPLISEVEANESFATLLKKTQIEVNGFLRYAQPGTASSNLNRRFNVVLNYINASFSNFNDIPTISEWVHPEHCDARHHLRLHVHDFDGSGNIQLHFDLNENIFAAHQRTLVPQHFLTLLDAFINDRNQPIDSIPLLTKQETKHLLVDFNDKTQDFSKESMVDLFEKQANLTPEKDCIVFKEQRFSYQEINQKANQLAHYLAGKNIKKGQKIMVCLKRSPEFVISVLAVLKTGAVFIPITSTYPNERVLDILTDSEAALLISDSRLTACMNVDNIKTLFINEIQADLKSHSIENLGQDISDEIAYMIYTSGSTGRPKGVMIGHDSLTNYINWAAKHYDVDQSSNIPLFTTIGFDLTITSLFLPLVFGGKMHIYQEGQAKADLSILEVIEDNQVDFIKLTPSHLALLKGKELCESNIKTMIVGGEDFKTELAKDIQKAFGGKLDIYNEYGPTEATVGCIVHKFNASDTKNSIPIGQPIANTNVFVLDNHLHAVPQGVVGELHLSGTGLAKGYWNLPKLTEEKFIANPFKANTKLYKTGDLVRLNDNGIIEFLGRKDNQVKLDGYRIELGEIETLLNAHEGIKDCVVEVVERKKANVDEVHNCLRCGLPSNYPNVKIEDDGICELCHSFEGYQQKVHKYFKTDKDLKYIFDQVKKTNKGEYDCIALLSGGKDSSYALAKLVEMNVRVLAFTLDNGYISEQAKENIRRVVEKLGVDHVFARTPAMNEIFVDSLHRYSNVCNGCFKTIYTLSIQLALEKQIPYIITGLSRGQFFETRLTEELFWDKEFDIQKIDGIILEARKAYHRTDDVVNKALGTIEIFEDDTVFQKVQFLDFYRYSDVSMDEMIDYLENKLPWVRPTDTGRSTNCLINQVGIHVHKTKEGYSNYSFPYSWDVRVGHKTREGALEEINEYIDVKEVERIMDEIGYTEINNYQQKHLVAYFTTSETVDTTGLQQKLGQKLPNYMIPTRFKELDDFPLSSNGKIDRIALREIDTSTVTTKIEFVAPQTEFEELVAEIWQEVLNISEIGIYDNFLEIGGNSLIAIRIMARINEAFELNISLNRIFEMPTITSLASHIEEVITELLAGMED